MRISLSIVLVGAAIFSASLGAAELPSEHAARMKLGLSLFQKTIRPALDEHCVRCHGGEKTRSGFDLTTRELLMKGGEAGPAIDLESPKSSFLLGLIRHEEEPFMPAKKPKLDPKLLEAFATWIELGAPYDKPLIDKADGAAVEMTVTDADREFWSFQPLKPVKLAEVNGDWPETGIDRFVFAKLQQQGLQPNEPAEQRTFIRRAYLDLIGLPPTPEQLESALKKSPAELIDDLLASPHYGERWGRHWLDAARFAESHGFEQDYNREYAFHYRDFVIKALNADMPYDQFVRWQLAGDEIAPSDPLAMMATGFLGAGVFPTQLTEKEFESARYDELDDMAATTGTAMLGLTIGCARCHDHKFDPIPVKDYYRLVSTFTTTIRSEIDLDLDPAGYQKALTEWQSAHSKVEQSLAAYEESQPVRENFDRWLKTEAASARQESPWSILEFSELKSSGGATLTPQPDSSILLSGKNAGAELLTFTAKVGAKDLKHLRIEALTDPSMKGKGPGRAGNGNFALSDLKVSVRPSGDSKAKPVPVKLVGAKATHQQNEGNLSVASAIDGDPKGTGWAVDAGGIGKDQAAVFAFAESISIDGGAVLKIEMNFANNGQHTIGRPRLSVSADPEPPVAVGDGQSESLTAAFDALAAGKLLPEHRGALFPVFAKTDPKWNGLDASVRESFSKKPEPNVAKVQVTSEGFPPTKHHADGRGFPHFYPETHFLSRGDANQKKGVAEQGFLQVLMRDGKTTADWQMSPPENGRTSYRRRSLANWITDVETGAGHLLARVIVNRLWHHHFGRGIVATPNDFGLQGAEPTHPELLDFLANRLIENGWKLKALHREIMLSAAYRQSSAPSADKAAIDPDNRWVWRFEPRRLEAEIVRDTMLAVSGQLDPTMFGKGTLSEVHNRRSIYFMIKRSRLVPMMQIFDQPEPLVSQGSRPSTTIAPQALLFMNNPQVVGWAASLAAQIERENPDDAIREGYRRTLGREPSAAELEANRAFVDAQTSSYESGNARQLALADFCQVLFGLNEFVYLP